ncbi:hypothetical protein PAXRUDRAFT_171347, partial [Paxillus rubicundulus Ve08.2h10]
KKRRADGVLTIFSDRCMVKFCHTGPGGILETVKGRWCNVCKASDEFVKNYGKCRAFHVRSNLSCWQHIQSNYELYDSRCEERSLKPHHHCVLRDILKAKHNAKKQGKSGQQ